MTTNTPADWPALPTETEIYILPNGEIVVADLPAELAAQLDSLSTLSFQEACARPVENEEIQSGDPLETSHVAS